MTIVFDRSPPRNFRASEEGTREIDDSKTQFDVKAVEGSSTLIPTKRRFIEDGSTMTDLSNPGADFNSVGGSIMSRAKMKLLGDRDAEDRISNLPEELIHCIIKHLPVHDAVRTTTLSKAWRKIWIMHPHLFLGYKFYTRLIFEKDQDRHASEYKKAVERIFSVHTGPILDFYLYVPRQLKHCPIHWLVEHLSKKGVRTLHLVTSYRPVYVIPSSLFDCEELTQLILSKWIFIPYRSGNFTKLIWVQFNEVSITAPISFGSQLKVLELENCSGIEHLDCQFISSNNLTRLLISSSTKIDWRWFECTRKLKFLGLGLVPADSNMKDVINLVKLLSNIPSCVTLYLNGPTLQLLGRGPSILTRITTNVLNINELRLRQLRLYNTYQISNTLFLIRSFPNLQELCIYLELKETCLDPEKLPVERFLKALDWKHVCLDQLLTVEINGVAGSRSIIYFIKFVLASSPVLRKMSVFCSTNFKCPQEKLRIKQELQQFPRLSLEAQIVFC